MSASLKLPVRYAELDQDERRTVRDEYTRLQGGLCHYCGTPLKGSPAPEVSQKYVNRKLFPEGFFDYLVHLHHSHQTGLTLGAVHARCNAVLWQYHGE